MNWNWIIEHWPYVLGAAVALLSALNAFATRHPDEVRGGVRHLLLLALDIVSAIQSRGSGSGTRGPIGALKIPGQLSPASDSLRRRVTDADRR